MGGGVVVIGEYSVNLNSSMHYTQQNPRQQVKQMHSISKESVLCRCWMDGRKGIWPVDCVGRYWRGYLYEARYK